MPCLRKQHRNNVPILRGEKHVISLKSLHQAGFETARQAATLAKIRALTIAPCPSLKQCTGIYVYNIATDKATAEINNEMKSASTIKVLHYIYIEANNAEKKTMNCSFSSPMRRLLQATAKPHFIVIGPTISV